MRAGFATASGRGYVDLVWAGGVPSQVAKSGATTDVRLGSDIVASLRLDDSQSSTLRWLGDASQPVTVPLPSRDQRSALTPDAE